MAKKRLDQILVERELASDLKEAQALILAGKVFSQDSKLEKAGLTLPEEAPLRVKGPEHPYVSRGGLKLEAALKRNGIRVQGLVCADLGASTGGFTDCLLQQGAVKVFAVDSGTNQLDWSLRKDPRVVVMEQTNARELQAKDLGGEVEFACADLSFISLEKILPTIFRILRPGSFWVALIKPQFEVSKDEVPKGGVIVDPALRQKVCERIHTAAIEIGLEAGEPFESPIAGRDGNIEFLIAGRKS